MNNMPRKTKYRAISISVIVATERSLKYTQRLLNSIEKNQYPHVEVIVIACPQSSIKKINATYRFPVRLIRTTCCNIAEQRNMGIHAAHGTWCYFLDDDALLLPRSLHNIRTYLMRHSSQIVGGPVISSTFHTFQFFEGYIMDDLRLHIQRVSREPPLSRVLCPLLMGTNLLVQTSLLRGKLGLFDEKIAYFNDEVDLLLRAHTLHIPIVNTPTLSIIHTLAYQSKRINKNGIMTDFSASVENKLYVWKKHHQIIPMTGFVIQFAKEIGWKVRYIFAMNTRKHSFRRLFFSLSSLVYGLIRGLLK